MRNFRSRSRSRGGRRPAPRLDRRVRWHLSAAGSDAVWGRRSVCICAAAAQHGAAGGACNTAGADGWPAAEERGALLWRAGGGPGVLRAAENVGANLDVMKWERVRLRDHRGKALGTTCPTISSVVVVAIAFLVMFFVIRFT